MYWAYLQTRGQHIASKEGYFFRRTTRRCYRPSGEQAERPLLAEPAKTSDCQLHI